MLLRVFLAVGLATLVKALGAAPAMLPFPPDLMVAADGSGDFTTVHAAVQSIPKNNRERRVIFVKNGTYRERVRVDAACLTIRGEDRTGTRLEFAHPASAPIDDLGRSVLELSASANDFVLENLTVENTHGVIGQHAFAILGRADRVVLQDCDILSLGNDTLALWRGRPEDAAEVAAALSGADSSVARDGGRYYHARVRVHGSVDFICPRGWCFMTDSVVTQVNPKATAAMWHDGRNNPEKKFVMRNCRFDGPPDWYLARHHHDAQFFFIECTFSATMRDKPPYRVVYPLNGGTPSEADIANNKRYDLTNLYGERAYFQASRRAGGNYAWHRDNLADAPGSPKSEQVTAKWTFGGTWDPERTDAPVITALRVREQAIELELSEAVTVKGSPRIALTGGKSADYQSGSGTKFLSFAAPAAGKGIGVTKLDLNDGAIVATEAGSSLRLANPNLPSP
jgi:pectinesterase